MLVLVSVGVGGLSITRVGGLPTTRVGGILETSVGVPSIRD